MKVLFLWLPFTLCAISCSDDKLKTTSPGYDPFFSAVVVSDADQSSKWYQSVFELTEKIIQTDPGGSFTIVILEKPNMVLELIESTGSLGQTQLLLDQPTGTQMQGQIKIGFKVADADEWLSHLATLKIHVPQVWIDAVTKKRNLIISDPDGNLIQFFE